MRTCSRRSPIRSSCPPGHRTRKTSPQRPGEPRARRSRRPSAFQYTGHRAGVSRAGDQVRHRPRWHCHWAASALVLVYRRDAFSRPANIDAAHEAGITLEPPSTWAQLDALARFFQGRDWNGDGAPDHGIAAVLGQDSEGPRRHDLSGPRSQPGPASRPVFLPLRCRFDDAADRFSPVRRGSS